MSTPENKIAELDEAAQAELNKVLGTALGVAREQLEEQGVFLPFAIAVEPATEENAEPELRLLAVQPTEDLDDPEADIDAEVMMADLVQLLQDQRDSFNAVAFVSDVTLLDDATDAVHVLAEHRHGGSVAIVQPYTAPDPETGIWEFAEPSAEGGQIQVWA
ncbi:hypothetical protein DQ353_13035 [Arthrobacter sp. AQ5-05]|uniref:hypothetical protein n=1 Tax=Arthrobacter sp. AQ5-05 TaxID=2184581 RepID=UPI000DCE7D96|nr:hypothetical protein [Arthrobacter sp. AQ5-05]RAX48846.1 hypothetical protein DQ353_13035 [Arthrobacter sp. AQ5-05]